MTLQSQAFPGINQSAEGNFEKNSGQRSNTESLASTRPLTGPLELVHVQLSRHSQY